MTLKDAVLQAINEGHIRGSVEKLRERADEIFQEYRREFCKKFAFHAAKNGNLNAYNKYFDEYTDILSNSYNYVSYQVAMSVRKEWQRNNDMVFDGRTYKGQPKRHQVEPELLQAV